jgi:poly-gamma-glutamate biosynthesis protein PgsC/CapC
MSSYLFSDDVVRVLLVVGVLFSVLFYERFQLTTGGVIVPTYLTLAILRPFTVALTILCGILTWFIVSKIIARRIILYGRRRFEVEALVGLALVGIVTIVHFFVPTLGSTDITVSTIGFLVPGILAHDMGRQGPLSTVGAVVATTGVLALFMYIYTTLLNRIAPDSDAILHLATVTGFNPRLLIVAVFVSVITGMVVFGKLGLRPGGFVTGAYVAMLIPRWADLGYLAVVAVLTWLVTAKLLMPRLPIFGRRKLSMMVLFAALFAWTIELIVRAITDGQWIPGSGIVLMTLMVPALLANDAARQGWERTGWGIGITAASVYGVTNLIGAAAIALGQL